MEDNLNTTDRIIRILLALIFAVIYYNNVITGVIGIALLVFGAILMLTSFARFSPIYRILGISTCRTKMYGEKNSH